MCSMRCDRPASSSASPTLPVPIQNPSATDRTESIDSVTTRTPESTSVRRGWSNWVLAAIGVAPGAAARAARATAAAVAVAVAPATVTAVAARRTAVAAPGADRRQLLGGLAGDVGVVGQAQADAAALAVDLDHADLDLVAAVEDLLDRGHALAR